MKHTTFLGFTQLEPGDGLFDDNAGFTDRNLAVIARVLQAYTTHTHDGHAALVNPDTAPGLVFDVAGGSLPGDSAFNAGFTALDAEGGETALSPVVAGVTPAGLGAVPDPPTAVADYTAGTLPANSYYYVLTATDDTGGESEASDPTLVNIDPGNANGQVLLTDLLTTAAAAGGTGWRLYRSTNGGQLGLLGQGATEAFTDDGLPCLDPQLQPPVIDTSSGSGLATVTVPAAIIPADAVAVRVYASVDPAFPSPSLVGEQPVAGVDLAFDVDSFGLQSGSPPPVSTSIPGPPAVGGGGGGDAITAPLIPQLPSASWPPGPAELAAASITIGPADAPLAALVARYVDLEGLSDDVIFHAYGAGDFVAGDWIGDTAEFTWDATVPTGGLFGSGALNTDHLIVRDVAGAAYSDGVWQGQFGIDAAGWERLYVGGVTAASADEGVLGILDRAANKVQIVHVTAQDPLTYTVLASVTPTALPAVGQLVRLWLRRIGDRVHFMVLVNDSPVMDEWLTADLSAIPTLQFGAGLYGAFGARWSVADTTRVTMLEVAYSPSQVLELVALGAIAGSMTASGLPTWDLDTNTQTVLWRSDGTGGGFPDPNMWQPLSNIGAYVNGWDDVAGDGAQFVQWERRMLLRGRLAALLWAAGSNMVELAGWANPDRDRTFYVGADDGTTPGTARIDVLADNGVDPPRLVLVSTTLADPAASVSLDGIAWDLVMP